MAVIQDHLRSVQHLVKKLRMKTTYKNKVWRADAPVSATCSMRLTSMVPSQAGDTPLHTACKHNQDACVKWLASAMAARADVEATNKVWHA